MKRSDIKCPICQGIVNEMWFDSSSSTESMASFIVECWSGDTNTKSYHHLFRVKVFDLEVVELTKEDIQ